MRWRATCSPCNGSRLFWTSRPVTSALCCWSVITPMVIRCSVLCGLGSWNTLRSVIWCRRMTGRNSGVR